MTNIKRSAMHALVALPKAIDAATEQLKRIADTLAKMEEKDGPTIGQIVRDAIKKSESSKRLDEIEKTMEGIDGGVL